MKVAATVSGVESVTLAGGDKSLLLVIGDGVDSNKLTGKLKKKVGAAEIVELRTLDTFEEAAGSKEMAMVARSPAYSHWLYTTAPSGQARTPTTTTTIRHRLPPRAATGAATPGWWRSATRPTTRRWSRSTTTTPWTAPPAPATRRCRAAGATPMAAAYCSTYAGEAVIDGVANFKAATDQLLEFSLRSSHCVTDSFQ